MNQFPLVLQQLQQQLTLVTEKVNQHDELLTRLSVLEQENKELKKFLHDKELIIEKLQAQIPSHENSSASGRTEGGNNLNTQGSPKPNNTVPNYSTVASAAAHKPDPLATANKKGKKRLAAGRVFRTPATKGPQGYEYVYIGRSRKIQRSEVRKILRDSGVDLGRVLDICFPASEVIGILLHTQYVQDFTELMKAADAELVSGFDPLDPANIADPKYATLGVSERSSLILEFTATRCLQTLAFLRPLNVSGVGKYFVEQGWICEEDLSVSVAAAVKRFAVKEPKRAKFLFRRQLSSDSDSEDNGSVMEQ
ncbi:hypothetical protein BD408DRAFT_334928 [Parasitella parasitica]|nr:hypothetical protein BD408DRAFT_356838 [Parasitella parasitica]KAI8647508.1 hypothetical protein BD408DRAFT_334928 [Parasitella parasitica]